MKKTFIWWNTGLAPVRSSKDRLSPEQKSNALALIYDLIVAQRADFIALGEFNYSDVEELHKLDFAKEYDCLNGNIKAGGTRFDTCIFYRKDSLFLINHQNLVRSIDDRTHKVAQEYTLANVTPPHECFYIFVSHWPSRLNPEGIDIRINNGIFLREQCDKYLDLEIFKTSTVQNQKKDDAYIILMGDYNDEPFDDSLQKHLRASRDRSKVRKKKRMLYNPFWKNIGERKPHVPGENTSSYSGNHYYLGGKFTHWHTFDQIIFSSVFLREKGWHLNETETGVITSDILKEIIMDSKNIFDHLPVKGVIEKVE